MIRILLIEDDSILGSGLKRMLEQKGYSVRWARDLRTAQKENLTHDFDVVLLDLILPDGNGLAFCEDLRKSGSRLPILVLSAQVDEEAAVQGLSAGANDYIRKPFGYKELISRIATALREPLLRDDQVRFENLMLLRIQRRTLYAGQEVDFSRREFEILLLLVEKGGTVVTREQLVGAMDKSGEILDRTIDSHLSRIRSKLEKAGVKDLRITSVYGVGYRLERVA